MVRTRSSSAKKEENMKKKDVENTKRSRGGGGGGGKGGAGGDMDEEGFREFLAQLFPSDFAEQQLENVKSRKRRNKHKRDKGKSRKTSKPAEDSDASSRASYEDDGSVSDSDSTSSSGESAIAEPKKKGNKVMAWTVVDGKPRPLKIDTRSGEDPIMQAMAAMADHMNSSHSVKSRRKGKSGGNTKTKQAAKAESTDDSDDDPDYESTETGTESSESSSNQDNDSESDSVSTEELESEGDTFNEMFNEKDYKPEEDSDYTDSEDEEETPRDEETKRQQVKPGVRRSQRLQEKNGSGASVSTPKTKDVPRIELEEFEKGLQDKLNGIPAEFQKKCRSLWGEFKTRLEKERKSYIAQGKKEEKKTRKRNLSSFRKMLREGDTMNDLRYFNRVMSVEEQQKAIEEMERVKAYSRVDKPYRLRLLDAPIPPQIKAVALKKINALRYTNPGDSEYNKLKKWVDAFLHIPFGRHSHLDLKLTDGTERCHEFMENAKNILDEAVYGLNDVKLQVIQMLGQWVSNPLAVGSAVAIHGPMGTGKTTLVKDGISKILGREFIFIALGGATDSSFLEGHSYTYEGSTWGKIVDLLMQCQTMNPIIYFDELDKVSETPRGEEIIGILTHLTDTSQNDKFHDKYFSEIELDLSKCLFFFSYNDPERVNPILRDRMYTIKTNGYSSAEKVTIAEYHLLPKLLPQVGFSDSDISIPRETLEYITKEYTKDDEKGVRSLKRRLEIICTKLNLYRLLKPGTTMFGQKIPESVCFPMTVTPELVKELVHKEKEENNNWVMYT